MQQDSKKLEALFSSSQAFKCVQNNQVLMVCSQANCISPGLMCGIKNCLCHGNHLKCKTVFFQRFIQSIINRKQKIPKNVKQSYKELYQQINKLFGRLSQLKIKFETEQNYFGLLKEQVNFFQIIRQHKVNDICGKLINKMENCFQSQIEYSMIAKQQIQKEFFCINQSFDKILKDIEKKFAKKEKQNVSILFSDSKILQKEQDRNLLKKWLQDVKTGQLYLQSQLLFRASENNFDKNVFHQTCNGKQNTIVIVRNEYQKTFGGFAHPKWEKGQQIKWNIDSKVMSFLFSLDAKQKIKCCDTNYSTAYDESYGPVFGQKYDFYITQSANQNELSTFQPFYTYDIRKNNNKSNNKEYTKNAETYILLTGNIQQSFKVQQYEVYQIKGI